MSLYWMLVLGNISFVCGLFAALCGCAMLFVSGHFMFDLSTDDEDYGLWKRIVTGGWTAVFFMLLISIFVPSTENLMKIYVVDNVVEYIENNDKARELPDKVIECCDKLMNKYLEEDKDE